MKQKTNGDGVADIDENLDVDSVNKDSIDGGSVNDDANKKKDSVSYESYQRLLSQRKKDLERLNALELSLKEQERVKREQEESKLAEKGEYKKLIEIREQKIREMEEEIEKTRRLASETEEQLINRKKFEAVISRLPGRLADKDYYNLIDFNKIAIDPETKEIDDDSADEVVNVFVKKHGRLFDKKQVNMPNESNANAVNRIDYDAWLKLPFKEQKKYAWDQLKNVPK